jgi:hypothetical protein
MAAMAMALPGYGRRCTVCRKVATKQCRKCRVQPYCDEECQKSDWPNHRPLCGDPASSVLKVEDAKRGVGRGVFATKAHAAWSIISAERMLFGMIGDGEGLAEVAESMLKRQAKPVEWLESYGFTIRRAQLPPTAAPQMAAAAKRTNQSEKVVEAVWRIVYEYQFVISRRLSTDRLGTGLFTFASLINHSCTPNAMWICDADASCRMLALRPIQAGEELTVSYRAMLGIDSFRHADVWMLYDIFNNALCRCGSARCLHRGLTEDEALNAVNRVTDRRQDYWTDPLANEDALKTVAVIRALIPPPTILHASTKPHTTPTLMQTVPPLTPKSAPAASIGLSSASIAKGDPPQSKSNVVEEVPGWTPPGSVEPKLVQALVLAGDALSHTPIQLFAMTSGMSTPGLAALLLGALEAAHTDDPEMTLRLAVLEWRIRAADPTNKLPSDCRRVPAHILRFLAN